MKDVAKSPDDANFAGAGDDAARNCFELDRYIVGQKDAKRAVAIALRNRWRRQLVPDDLRDEIAPKNIIMIGPTGVGKTEISAAWPNSLRRLSSKSKRPNLLKSATSAATLSRSSAT